MALVTEHRVPMRASKYYGRVLLALAAASCCMAQDAGTGTGQVPASQQPAAPHPSSSQTKKSTHHVQVPVDDAQPEELTQAESAIEKHDYATAEPLLRKLVARDAGSYVAWFDLGFVENELGHVDDSIAAYRKSVAAKPDVFESNLNLGVQLAKSGSPDAEQFLRAATRLKPTSNVEEGQYRAWIALAQTITKAKPEEALAAYRRAAKLQPKEIETHLAAGHILEEENKFADSEQEYKQALAIDSKSYDAVIGLANIYMRGHRFPEAEDYLRKLLVDQPNSAPVHIQLGRVLAAEDKNDAAIAELQTGVKLAPGEETALRELADLYATAKKNDQAEAVYRQLLAAHPNDAELHDGLGKALMFQKKSTDAQQEFFTAIKLRPDFGNAYYDLAFTANDNKEYPLVIRSLDLRAKMLPETPMTYFLRASAYDHLRDFKNAAANFHLFLKVAGGKYPDQEWQATHRLIAIEPNKH
jgi:tetratricopeptide (TPR) repeat protein